MWNALTAAAPGPGVQEDAPDAPLPLRARVAAAPWRRRLAARPTVDRAYRSSVALVGGLVVAVGLVTVPLPGPGWLTVLVGLLVLSSEFSSAERLLGSTARQVQRWTRWLEEQALGVRVAVATSSALLGYVVLAVTLRILGVPGWVPSWAPLL